MAARTARLGSMLYQDSDGRYRYATAGDIIQVHPDYLERFDRLNVLLGEKSATPVAMVEVSEKDLPTEEPVETKPKPRRGRPPKKVAPEA